MIMSRTGNICIAVNVGILIFAGAAVWKSQSALRTTQAEIAQLEAELRDLGASSAISKQSGAPPRPDASRTPTSPVAEQSGELLKRLSELTQMQANTLALVQTLVDKNAEAESPEQKSKQQAAALSKSEALLTDQLQALTNAKRRMEEQLTLLQVPDDVVGLNPDTGLALPSLKEYYPYLEAKRATFEAERAVESLQRRLRQMKIDAATPTPQ
jgi:hypothetical protein